MEHQEGCLICGDKLIYLQNSEKLTCFYCNKAYGSNGKCVNGHYVCDRCHSSPANEIIQQYCITTKSELPLEIALTLMRNPAIKMHGPEHHFLVPAVLLAAYFNVMGDSEEKERTIRKARERAANILGGFCGFYGNCGAAVGTGIFVSLITKATPLSKEEWRLSNLITAKSLAAIANSGGPRCCKRDSYLAIVEAGKFMEEHFGTKIEVESQQKCEFSSLNKECTRNNCPFFVGLGVAGDKIERS